MTTATADQLTPLFSYLIRGDTLNFPLEITQDITVPIWTTETQINEDEYVRGTVITDYYFQCTASGITGVTEPDWESYSNIDDTITDGDVEWINKGKLFLTEGTDIAEQPVSIVGWKFFVTIKSDLEDSDEEAQVAFNYEFEDSEKTRVGKKLVMIPASLMINLIPGTVYMDTQMVIPNGEDESIVITFGLSKEKVYADSSRRITE